MLIDGIYQLDGTERVVKTAHKVPCGDLVETEYFSLVTGELLRKDVNVVVDEKLLMGSQAGV